MFFTTQDSLRGLWRQVNEIVDERVKAIVIQIVNKCLLNAYYVYAGPGDTMATKADMIS